MKIYLHSETVSVSLAALYREDGYQMRLLLAVFDNSRLRQ